MLYIIIFLVVLAVFYYYLVVVKMGNLSFWKKAMKNPEFFYQELLDDDAWIIDDGSEKIDKSKFEGPYLLNVPSIGKTIKFYGEIGKYEESEKRIEKKIK